MTDRRGHQGWASEPFDALIVSTNGKKLLPFGSYQWTRMKETRKKEVKWILLDIMAVPLFTNPNYSSTSKLV